MFGIGPGEVVVIFIVILLLFGGEKFPELMKGVSQGLGEFRKGVDETRRAAFRAINEMAEEEPKPVEPKPVEPTLPTPTKEPTAQHHDLDQSTVEHHEGAQD